MRDPSFENFDCESCQDHEFENPEFRNCSLIYEEDEYKNESFSFVPKWSGEELNSCPLSLLILSGVSGWMEMWKNLKEFNLPPNKGGQYDQCQTTMRYLRVIQDEWNRIDNLEFKKD